MSDFRVGIYTIGQTPRPDLAAILGERFAENRLVMRGALDDLPADAIPADARQPQPLETRLRDGRRVVVDESFVQPRLQRLIRAGDEWVAAHLVMCAGRFPGLTAQRPLVLPSRAAADELRRRGFRVLQVLVPFAGQAAVAQRKWESCGFRCTVDVFDERVTDPAAFASREHPALRVAEVNADAEAVVIDYVGLAAAARDDLAAQVDKPVFDVGILAIAALETALARTIRGDTRHRELAEGQGRP